MSRYRIVVTYTGGVSAEVDKALDRLVGKPCAGSGYCFDDGVRDRDWLFSTKAAAERAIDRLATWTSPGGRHNVKIKMQEVRS